MTNDKLLEVMNAKVTNAEQWATEAKNNNDQDSFKLHTIQVSVYKEIIDIISMNQTPDA